MTGLSTPEVAGSSPVAPVKYLQIGIFCCRCRRKRPPAYFHPAHIPHGNRRTVLARAGNPRNPWRRPQGSVVAVCFKLGNGLPA
jgi:hypothetical protein